MESSSRFRRYKQIRPFPIETNVPIPKLGTTQWSKMTITIRNMAIGDSFVYPNNNTAPYKAAKKAGIKIRTSKVNGEGWRVWRVE
jgi:hypothetical protein